MPSTPASCKASTTKLDPEDFIRAIAAVLRHHHPNAIAILPRAQQGSIHSPPHLFVCGNFPCDLVVHHPELCVAYISICLLAGMCLLIANES